MPCMKIFHRLSDFFITVLLWIYFLGGSIGLFFLFYLPAYFFAKNRARVFQYINHVHMRNFFALLRLLAYRTRFDIQEEVRNIRGAVIVCNHLSYLDPILLVSLLPRQCTIIKSTFLKVPFFGLMLQAAGYIPSAPREMLGPAMIRNLETIKKNLETGADLFIFPEGTRSRDGKLAPFNKGVFSIARYCNAPLKLVYIQGTNVLFRPGTFLFNTRTSNSIKVELIGSLEPDYKSTDFSISSLADEARKCFADRIAQNGNE
jgi:1-acyl-sn-glycerol-3-phosphate acyltransferase